MGIVKKGSFLMPIFLFLLPHASWQRCEGFSIVYVAFSIVISSNTHLSSLRIKNVSVMSYLSNTYLVSLLPEKSIEGTQLLPGSSIDIAVNSDDE